MSRNKPDNQDDSEAEHSFGSSRVFRDTLYTSRTLILPDGGTVLVTKGHVTAISDEEFVFLKAHPDLELAQE